MRGAPAIWIAGSVDWDVPIVGGDVAGWAAHVQAQAERLLDQTARTAAWRTASEALLTALWKLPALAKRIATEEYLDLIAGFPSEEATRALFACAQQTGPVPWLDKHATGLARAGLPIFELNSYGWDLRPAGSEGV